MGATLLLSFPRATVEARGTGHVGAGLLCGGRIPSQGIDTTYTTGVESGGFITTDVRARVNLVGEWLLAAVGPGWAWSKNVPYVHGAIGVRTGRDARWGLDFTVEAYRVEWRRLTAEYQGGIVQTVIDDARYRRWETAFGVRVAVDFPL